MSALRVTNSKDHGSMLIPRDAVVRICEVVPMTDVPEGFEGARSYIALRDGSSVWLTNAYRQLDSQWKDVPYVPIDDEGIIETTGQSTN